jgi:hypothetical protein
MRRLTSNDDSQLEHTCVEHSHWLEAERFAVGVALSTVPLKESIDASLSKVCPSESHVLGAVNRRVRHEERVLGARIGGDDALDVTHEEVPLRVLVCEVGERSGHLDVPLELRIFRYRSLIVPCAFDARVVRV